MNLGKENEKTEFKSSLTELDAGIKSLTSMLNACNNATVYFGVDDNGEIIGINYGDGTDRKIKDKIQIKVKPMLISNIEVLRTTDNKIYLKLSADGKDIPYSFDGRFYVRNGARDEQADSNLFRKMVASNIKDMIEEKESIFQDLTFNYLKNSLIASGIHIISDEAMLKSYKLLTNNNKLNMTAFLLSDQNNIPIKIIRFEGNDKVKMLDKKEWVNQSLLKTFNEVMEYLDIYNKNKIEIGTIYRKETPLFDTDSLREAVVNAFIHNDWKNEVPPSIYIFNDRIDVESYGELPYKLTLDDFYTGTSMPINAGLFVIFMAKQIAERSGHGVPTIVKTYGKEAFKLTSGMIRVSIKFNFGFNDVTTPMTTPITTPMEDKTTQEKILELIRKNKEISASEMAEKIGITRDGIRYHLDIMKDKGIIKHEGKTKSGFWVIL